MFTISILQFLVSLTISNTPSFAKEYILFSGNTVIKNYSKVIRNLEPGDIIKYDSTHSFTIRGDSFFSPQEGIGTGTWSIFYPIEGLSKSGKKKCIRLPLSVNEDIKTYMQFHGNYETWNKTFATGYEILRSNHVFVPEVYLKESIPGRVVVEEEIIPFFSYDEFLSDKFRENLGEPLVEKVKSHLKEFIKSTWAFKRFGDLHDRQLFYTERGWLLIDWNDANATASTVESGHIFEFDHQERMMLNGYGRGELMTDHTPQKLTWPDKLFSREEITKLIIDERVKNGLHDDRCESFLRKFIRNTFGM